MNKLEKYGFVYDENKSEFYRIFNNSVFKKVHIDTYIESPYILLSRMIYKNAKSSIEDKRFTLIKDDCVLVNVIIGNIDNCMVKKHNDYLYEFVFKIHNVCYKSVVAI